MNGLTVPFGALLAYFGFVVTIFVAGFMPADSGSRVRLRRLVLGVSACVGLLGVGMFTGLVKPPWDWTGKVAIGSIHVHNWATGRIEFPRPGSSFADTWSAERCVRCGLVRYRPKGFDGGLVDAPPASWPFFVAYRPPDDESAEFEAELARATAAKGKGD